MASEAKQCAICGYGEMNPRHQAKGMTRHEFVPKAASETKQELTGRTLEEWARELAKDYQTDITKMQTTSALMAAFARAVLEEAALIADEHEGIAERIRQIGGSHE